MNKSLLCSGGKAFLLLAIALRATANLRQHRIANAILRSEILSLMRFWAYKMTLDG